MDSNSGFSEVGPETAPLTVEQQAGLSVGPRVRPAGPANPHAENPPWTAVDLLIAAFFLLLTVGVVQFGLMRVVGVSTEEMEKNPRALILVPSMMFGYVALLATMYVRVANAQVLGFWNMVAWSWPKGMRWLLSVAGGLVLAVGLGALSHVLPFPKSIPMERYFRDRQAAYVLLVMGVAVAPFAEEMMFRGFLYPVLDRGLQTLFMVQRRLLNGVKWLLFAAGWGYLIHRVAVSHFLEHSAASAVSLLFALLIFPIFGFFFFYRWLRNKQLDSVVLCGLSVCTWGLISRAVSERAFVFTTAALLAVASVFGLIGLAGALSPTAASRLGRVLAVLVTSVAFALVHSEQLGEAWGPLLVIFIVGLVLTTTRVLTKSVAPGFLVHVAYNLTLFTGLYLGSDHFRHLERISQ